MDEVSAKLVLKQLTEECNRQSIKRNHQHTCSGHLERYTRDLIASKIASSLDMKLGSIIMHHKPNGSACHAWKHSQRSPPGATSFMSELFIGKYMITIFCDSEGPILVHVLKQGSAVANVKCCSML